MLHRARGTVPRQPRTNMFVRVAHKVDRFAKVDEDGNPIPSHAELAMRYGCDEDKTPDPFKNLMTEKEFMPTTNEKKKMRNPNLPFKPVIETTFQIQFYRMCRKPSPVEWYEMRRLIALMMRSNGRMTRLEFTEDADMQRLAEKKGMDINRLFGKYNKMWNKVGSFF